MLIERLTSLLLRGSGAEFHSCGPPLRSGYPALQRIISGSALQGFGSVSNFVVAKIVRLMAPLLWHAQAPFLTPAVPARSSGLAPAPPGWQCRSNADVAKIRPDLTGGSAGIERRPDSA